MLDGVGGQRHAPAALPPGKTRYPLYKRLGRPQGWSGQVQKTSPPPEFDPWTIQPVASHNTNCAIPAHNFWISLILFGFPQELSAPPQKYYTHTLSLSLFRFPW